MARAKAPTLTVVGSPGSLPPDGPEIEDERPVIRVVNGQLESVVTQAEDALLASRANLYQRAGAIVRPSYCVVKISQGRKTKVLRPVQVSAAHILERMTSAATFTRFDLRSEDWVVTDCPSKVAVTYAAREGLWRLPHLIGIITVPTLRDDGSILERPGYDAQTGLLFDPQGARFAPIPDEPTQEDAFEALGIIKRIIHKFPFVQPEHRSVALSGILTALVRRSIDTAPIHCFSAPTAGSGKSMLVDIAAIVSTGKMCPVISQGGKEEETEKRLGAEFIAGSPLVSIDNCDQPLSGDLLCQLVTQQMVKIRVLGLSKSVDVIPNATMFATGNNLRIAGDLTRRSILCCLDHGVERPELLSFEEDAIQIATTAYPHYAIAGLTILRAFHVAGRPRQSPALGNFDQWSRWVRDALIWLGEADPVATMERVRASDPKLESIAAVFSGWQDAMQDRRVSAKQLIDAANAKRTIFEDGAATTEYINETLREALLVVAGERGLISSRRLGIWIAATRERVVSGHKIVEDGVAHGSKLWRLSPVSEGS